MDAERTHSRLWLLRLVLPGRWGRWFTSIGIFALCYALLTMGGVLHQDDQTVSSSTGLFFCTLLAYIVPIYHFITERSRASMRDLAPVLDVDAQQIAQWEKALSHKGPRWVRWTFLLGLTAGVGHNSLLWLSLETMVSVLNAPGGIALTISTLVIWMVMSFAIAGLIDNAMVFNRVTRHVEVDLLNPNSLTPFATVSVSSTLALIGAQASFPVMMIDGFSAASAIPGLIATSVPMIWLFVLPIWPVHRKLASIKRTTLSHLTAQIQSISKTSDNRNRIQERALMELQPLLTYRREIMQAPEWPFDIGVLSRLMLYLIIPPLTWVAAALIENVVDAAL